MSFDLYAEYEPCSHCGRSYDSIDIANATHNINSMVERVFEAVGITLEGTDPGRGYARRSWGRLHGHRLKDIRGQIADALGWFEAHEEELRPMNPPNGWGSTMCISRVLAALLTAADNHPDAKVRASG